MGRRFLISTALGDLGALALATVVASLLLPDFGTVLPWQSQPDVWPLLGAMGGGALLGSYVSARSWASGAPRPSYGRAVTIAVIAVAFTAVFVLLTRVYWSRPFLATASAGWLVLMLSHRWVRRLRPWAESFVLVTGEKALVDDLRSAPHADIVDLLSPGGEAPDAPYPEGTVLAVDLRAVLSDEMARYVSSCHMAGLPIRGFTGAYEEHTGRLPIVHLVEGWELTVPLNAAGFYVQAKRSIDVALIALTSPLWLVAAAIIALAIRLDSPGKAIFSQPRVGRHGKVFTMYKFRTMVANAEANGASFARPGDERLTGVGKLLRRFRADEIPQLWNVLKGDLSLVGPRPEQVAFVEHFEHTIPFYGHRHLVRPGVTGWAQVNFGYADDEVDTIEKLSYDLYYVKNVSPWLDLSILGRSIWTVLSGFGAR